MLLRKVLDELQHGAVCYQIQRTLSLVVGVADVSTFLRQETGDSHGDVQLSVPQETRGVQLWTQKEEERMKRKAGRERNKSSNEKGRIFFFPQIELKQVKDGVKSSIKGGSLMRVIQI